MATTTLKARFTVCVKTASVWASYETIPLKGEICMESDTLKIKVGDGTNKFSALKYVNITPDELTASSHSHTNKAILDQITAAFTTTLKSKLDGIAAGAEVNVQADWNETTTTSDAYIKNKPTALPANGGDADTVGGFTVGCNVPADAKFTDTTYGAAGTSLGLIKTGGDLTIASGVATVNGLGDKVNKSTTVNGKALSGNITLSAADVSAIPASQKGAANGVASLDDSGKVPAAQLPSYVDDVIEGYLSQGKFYKESGHTTEITGESGKIYIDLTSMKTYRWSGTAYAVVSETLALGTTSSTAFRGDQGKVAYDHSQAAHAPSNAERNAIVTVKVNGSAQEIDGSRAVDITVPTAMSELENDGNFATKSDNVASATKLATSRTFSITGGATAAAVSFNGTDNVALSVTALDAAKLQLASGDTLVLDGNF